VDGLQTVIVVNNDNNDKRAAAVEKYMIEEALKAGVVK
jgi:hypothetical protein